MKTDIKWIAVCIIGMSMALTLHNRALAGLQFFACASLLVVKLLRK